MGCLKVITDIIINCFADYVLVVKKNQKQLHQDIQDEIGLGKIVQIDHSEHMNHRCIEARKCY